MIRKGSHADVPFMRSMLAHAYAWRVNALDAEIPLTRYVDNWGRAGDLAVIAHRDGQPGRRRLVQRVFPADEPGYGFVDEQTPELTISVVPSRRRHGVGQELLDALLAKAKARRAREPSRCRWRRIRRRSRSTSATASSRRASRTAAS